MKFSQAAQYLSTLPEQQSVLLLGPPGIGKTALARMVARKRCEAVGGIVVEGHEYRRALAAEQKKPKDQQRPVGLAEVRDLCSHLPEDLLGLPMKADEDGQPVTDYAVPRWLHRLSYEGMHGVLVLDDLAAASPAIQTAAFKLVLERQSGDCKLSDHVQIIATANRKEDKSNATLLPAALRNRCLIETLEVNVEEWCKWALGSGMGGDVPAFMMWKPGHLSKLPKDADDNGAFATPRSWAMVAAALEAAKKHDNVLSVAKGLVGEGVATEFTAFVRLRTEIPDPKSILMNPKQALPKDKIPSSKNADRLIALVTAIAECAAPLSVEKGKDAKDIPVLLLAALDWVTQGGREYASHGILTYSACNGNVAALIRTAREGRDDPRFSTLLHHLKGSLLPGGGN